MSEALARRAVAEPAKLAIHGGAPVRATPMPARRAFGEAEMDMLNQALAYYREHNVDPGYQGPYEKLYTDRFVAQMGGGYADAVATGTAALFVAIAALDLPKGSEVIVSPITDPGTLSAIILNGLKPRLADSVPDSYNIGAGQFLARLAPAVSAAVVVHGAGQAADIAAIVAAARARGVKVIEDCSQAHGARHKGRAVGSFGDIAAFSTMYRKAHVAGPSGGLVYSRDLELFRRALAHADRGKPRWRADFDDRDPSGYLFPALNLNTDELSCAIGMASLGRLADTVTRRQAFAMEFVARLIDRADICRPYACAPGDSPFFLPVIVDVERVACTKIELAEAVRAEGIDLNPHYKYLVADWPWVRPYLADDFDPPNARSIRDRSFNLYLNENYGEAEVADAVAAMVKVERFFAKN